MIYRFKSVFYLEAINNNLQFKLVFYLELINYDLQFEVTVLFKISKLLFKNLNQCSIWN